MSAHRPPHRSIPSITSASVKTSHQISLDRRLLFPNLPASKELPPLLASPVPPELTRESYDFIALALRAFVNPWWTKLTRYDKEFLPEINRILCLTARSLEERVLAADLLPIVFCDIPTLITQHYRDYRNAASKLSTSYADGSATSLPQLFHQLQPHMAVSANGQIEEEYFRQIVDHILKTCLPAEEYEPEAERFIIREIVLKVLLQDVIPKISQPWFIHRTMLDFLGPSGNRPPKVCFLDFFRRPN
jgi:PXA domain